MEPEPWGNVVSGMNKTMPIIQQNKLTFIFIIVTFTVINLQLYQLLHVMITCRGIWLGEDVSRRSFYPKMLRLLHRLKKSVDVLFPGDMDFLIRLPPV